MTNDERHIAVLNRMLENMDVYDSIQPTTERKKAIKAAIKALEQTTWIPVSERLPEEYEWVLITFDNEIEIALLDDDGWCYSSVGNDDWIAEHPPVAWMPLPPSYQGE